MAVPQCCSSVQGHDEGMNGQVLLKMAKAHAYLLGMGVVATGLGIYRFVGATLWLQGRVINVH